MKKQLIILSVLILAAGFTACKTSQIRMATGGTTGTYYAYGDEIRKIFSKKISIPIKILATGASKANILLLNAKEVEIAIVQNDVMDCAWNGVDLFRGEKIKSFSSMAALYAEACQIVVHPDSGISSIEDLRGKNVSVGDVGSGIELNARQILETYGISFNEITKHNMGFGASAEALREYKIDAFFCIAGAPTPAIVNLFKKGDIAILEIDGEHADQLIREHSFYTKYSIPAGTYEGQENEVQTIAVKAVFIVRAKLGEEIVYQMTKNLFESKAELEAAHIKGSRLSPDYAVEGISVPFHPGAVRYYREIGILQK